MINPISCENAEAGNDNVFIERVRNGTFTQKSSVSLCGKSKGAYAEKIRISLDRL